jgi:hypothetical protein
MAKRQCHGTKKNGEPCGASPLKGKDYCRRHIDPAERDTSDSTPAHSRETWDREAWLGCYEYSKRVSEACRMVGISRQTAYAERERNDEFAARWDELNAQVVEELEAEAYRRAVEGTDKMVVSAGKRLGTEKQFSDTLLTLLLKANRPEKYRERVDVAHSGGTTTTIRGRVDLSRLSPEQLEALEGISETLQDAA